MLAGMTMAQLAELAGLSQAAVSMALRNHPRISLAQRERVQALAREHGYQPHPALSSLMACRRRRSSLPDACLAYIDGYPDDSHFLAKVNTRETYRGIRERARELGLGVERFSTVDPALGGRRLDRVLKARGIRGVILGSSPALPLRVDLDWSAYCLAALSHYFQDQPVDRVMSDPWQIIETAMTELAARGYRRIGLAMTASTNAIGGQRFSGAFLNATLQRHLGEPLPPHLPAVMEAGGFMKWYRAHRPDAVIYFGNYVPAILAERGIRVPEEVGLVLIAVDRQETVAGINQNAFELGATLAERVAQLSYTNSTGLPRLPRTIYVDGSWQEGWSVRDGLPVRG
jgi:LacI family transcriptional regulator